MRVKYIKTENIKSNTFAHSVLLINRCCCCIDIGFSIVFLNIRRTRLQSSHRFIDFFFYFPIPENIPQRVFPLYLLLLTFILIDRIMRFIIRTCVSLCWSNTMIALSGRKIVVPLWRNHMRVLIWILLAKGASLRLASTVSDWKILICHMPSILFIGRTMVFEGVVAAACCCPVQEHGLLFLSLLLGVFLVGLGLHLLAHLSNLRVLRTLGYLGTLVRIWWWGSSYTFDFGIDGLTRWLLLISINFLYSLVNQLSILLHVQFLVVAHWRINYFRGLHLFSWVVELGQVRVRQDLSSCRTLWWVEL